MISAQSLSALVFLTLRLQLRSGARLVVFLQSVSPSVALRLLTGCATTQPSPLLTRLLRLQRKSRRQRRSLLRRLLLRRRQLRRTRTQRRTLSSPQLVGFLARKTALKVAVTLNFSYPGLETCFPGYVSKESHLKEDYALSNKHSNYSVCY